MSSFIHVLRCTMAITTELFYSSFTATQLCVSPPSQSAHPNSPLSSHQPSYSPSKPAPTSPTTTAPPSHPPAYQPPHPNSQDLTVYFKFIEFLVDNLEKIMLPVYIVLILICLSLLLPLIIFLKIFITYRNA